MEELDDIAMLNLVVALAFFSFWYFTCKAGMTLILINLCCLFVLIVLFNECEEDGRWYGPGNG